MSLIQSEVKLGFNSYTVVMRRASATWSKATRTKSTIMNLIYISHSQRSANSCNHHAVFADKIEWLMSDAIQTQM